jgi:hypothetical protein
MKRYWRDLQHPGNPTWGTWISLAIGVLWAGLALLKLVGDRDREAFPYLLFGIGIVCGEGANFLPALQSRLAGMLRFVATLLLGISFALMIATWIL